MERSGVICKPLQARKSPMATIVLSSRSFTPDLQKVFQGCSHMPKADFRLGVVDYSVLLSVWEIPEELGDLDPQA